MENNKKKKISLEIAGDSLTLITDESDDFVRDVAARLNSRMTELTRNSFRISKYDAALLCALDALCEKTKAEKRVRTVESQLSVAQLEISKLKEQVEQLSKNAVSAASAEPAEAPKPCDDSLGRLIREASDGETPADRVRALENYLDSKKSPEAEQSPQTREDKIKYIESLLRGNDNG